jgi:hypothetical protein
MRRLIVVAVGVVVAVCAMPGVAMAQALPGDSVTGRVVDCLAPPGDCLGSDSLTLDARSGPAGESPSGTVDVGVFGGSPSTSFGASTAVTCLSVVGNVAIIGVTSGPNPLPGRLVSVAGLIRVTDRGGPNSGLDTFELALQLDDLGPPLPGPTICSTFPSVGRVRVNDQGDLTVVDANPAPTSKDQCKNGGWRTYGIFKNQGDCVSFVATGGNNPPG